MVSEGTVLPASNTPQCITQTVREEKSEKKEIVIFFQFIEAASAHSEKLKTGCETDTGLHLVWHLSTDQQRKTQN